MAATKKFNVVENLLVYPSKKPTIEVVNDEYNGAHRYRIKLCKGFNAKKQNHEYVDKTVTLQFVQKNDDGSVVEGLQSEQVALVLLDRVIKLNERFPCESNQKQIKALEDYLAACKERVAERIERNVMGELKK